MRDFGKASAISGETGHREWQCDKDKLVTFQSKVQLALLSKSYNKVHIVLLH
jgi:hypothetical protein